jgi:hypothetical protein
MSSTQNNNNSKNILFYSTNCTTCRHLLMILKNENLLCYFELRCVDNMLDRLPPYIQKVPTMLVSNVNKPLVAEETFEWINQIKFFRQQQVMDLNKKIIQENMNTHNVVNSKKTTKPVEYLESEMSGFSDTFAYTKIDEPLPKSFFKVGDEDKISIYTAPDSGKKISNREQVKLTKEIEMRRVKQDNDFGDFMKQQQLKAIKESEQEKFGQK